MTCSVKLPNVGVGALVLPCRRLMYADNHGCCRKQLLIVSLAVYVCFDHQTMTATSVLLTEADVMRHRSRELRVMTVCVGGDGRQRRARQWSANWPACAPS